MDYYFFRTVISEILRCMKNIDRNHPKTEVLLFTERTLYDSVLRTISDLLLLVPYDPIPRLFIPPEGLV